MPQETLTFPPLYCIVGAYRLAHDPTLWKPMWAKCSKAAKQAGILALVWSILSWPLQRLFVYYFMSASASVTGFGALYSKVVETADVTDDSLPFRIPVPSLQTFATFMFVMGQVHAIMEFWLRRKLRECRNTAYIQTVKSRGKAADWWTEYTEEFANPPTEKAIKDAKKQGWYLKLASPFVRFLILKVFLLPVDFVPFFGMALGAALRSLTYGRMLHKSFFEAKRMSPLQIELWITERQTAYRSFGFVAALMERIPLLGLIFSVSNQIGAAMWAHDLEKRQQRVRSSQTAFPEQGVQLEEYHKKPTLKKLYKQVRDDQIPDEGDNETEKGEGSSSPSRSLASRTGGSFNGDGLAVLRRSEGQGMFTHLSFTFPLKLISPRASSRNATLQVGTLSGKCVSALYIVGYGGGLVSGDSVDLDIDVGSGCSLLVLTQGSTKVFKTRNSAPTRGVSTAFYQRNTKEDQEQGSEDGGATRQNLRFLIRKNATLVLLPDPVTCFANAKYDQVQHFDLRDKRTSSLIVLDWITPGRTAVPPSSTSLSQGRFNHLDAHTPTISEYTNPPKEMKDYSVPNRKPENWTFEFYRSRNEIRSSPPTQVVARDVLLLSQDHHLDTYVDPGSGKVVTDLARRNYPYGCYATLLLAGPDSVSIIERLKKEFEGIQVRPTVKVEIEEVMWSLSEVEDEEREGGVTVVRLAGKDSSTVRKWLFERLGELKNVIGSDLYRQALAS